MFSSLKGHCRNSSTTLMKHNFYKIAPRVQWGNPITCCDGDEAFVSYWRPMSLLYIVYWPIPDVQTSPQDFEKFNCQYLASKLTYSKRPGAKM
ncbi:hypothetical protein TSAR_013342 [Trichomalopsis sarcophagae]|uniref:Uncharacterized protein n=1 Tax=Trichomalopsis sarcophagae TaxID=543379 RepID=A0A232EHE4_9HYME|nr:hypothetical protein TSAR_013342 [Trichomalopsis sarcophagae]